MTDYRNLSDTGTSLKGLARIHFAEGTTMSEINENPNVPSFPQSGYNFVSKHYAMDPETEDLVFDGSDLREGMVVLIENDTYRQDIFVHARMQDDQMARARKYNQWCTVSNVLVNRNHVEFIATYDDGTKRKMREGIHAAWYVKKDSVPEEPSKLTGFDPVYEKDLLEYEASVKTAKAFQDYKDGEWSRAKRKTVAIARHVKLGKLLEELAKFGTAGYDDSAAAIKDCAENIQALFGEVAEGEESVTVPAEKLYDRIFGAVSLMTITAVSMGRRPKLPTRAELNDVCNVVTQQIVEAARKDSTEEEERARFGVYEGVFKAMSSKDGDAIHGERHQELLNILKVLLSLEIDLEEVQEQAAREYSLKIHALFGDFPAASDPNLEEKLANVVAVAFETVGIMARQRGLPNRSEYNALVKNTAKKITEIV